MIHHRLIRKITELIGERENLFYSTLLRVSWNFFWLVERYVSFFQTWFLPPFLLETERATFTEEFVSCYPFSKVLEVGTAYGQNLHLLGQMFPEVSFTGIDETFDSVEYGKPLLLAKGIENVNLLSMDADRLDDFQDKSFDVVISSAALLYVNSQTIRQVVKEMLRVCRKRIVLLELQVENKYYEAQDLGSFYMRDNGNGGYWVRDYKKLFENMCPGCKVVLRKVKKSVWQNEPWKEFGYVINIELN